LELPRAKNHSLFGHWYLGNNGEAGSADNFLKNNLIVERVRPNRFEKRSNPATPILFHAAGVGRSADSEKSGLVIHLAKLR